MKTILIINDRTAGAPGAARLALFIAQAFKADILLADACRTENSYCGVTAAGMPESEETVTETDMGDYLNLLNEQPNDFQPAIREMNIAALNEKQLAQVVNQNNVLLIVKTAAVEDNDHAPGRLNFHKLLGHVNCPLLLVPEGWPLKNPVRAVYLADLRYCRSEIISFLTRLSGKWHTELAIAHLSKNGLAELAETYAAELFKRAVPGREDQIAFHHIRERDPEKAIDVLVNGMQYDLLALGNNRFHFNAVMGMELNGHIPDYISVPLLVFPS